jgi:hypothetical protein
MKFHDTQQDTQMLHPVNLMLTTDQGMALARFLKRFGPSEFRANAIDDNEATAIQFAVHAVHHALAEAGLAPLP